jgi:hypothetical protein
LTRDKVIGTINIYTREQRTFSDEEVGFVKAVAGQAAIAIENARLMSETLEMKRTLEARKLVERAKGILQQKYNLTEEEAYLRLRNESRRLRRPMRDLAEAVILADDLRRSGRGLPGLAGRPRRHRRRRAKSLTVCSSKVGLTALQAQVSDIAKTLVDIRKNQVDMQRQISDLNAKMSLVLWVGAAVGVLLLGAAWKSLERKAGVAPLPSPAYAPYPPYAAPDFRQWEMEAVVRRVVEELRRDDEARQSPKSKPA